MIGPSAGRHLVVWLSLDSGSDREIRVPADVVPSEPQAVRIVGTVGGVEVAEEKRFS